MSKYIDAEKLIAEIERLKKRAEHFNEISLTRGEKDYWSGESGALELLIPFIASLQQEQPEVDLDKLVNEEFASHCRATEYGLVATYNRDELYQLIKRMALVFNARKED